MQQGERLRLWLDVVATLAIVAAAATFTWNVLAGGANAIRTARSAADPRQVGEAVVDVDTTATPTSIRPSHARIAVIEFSDFQCPYCAQYAREIYPQLETEFIRPGLVSYVFRHFPLPNHANALSASEAAECAGSQGKYLAMRASLFGGQGPLVPTRLFQHAAEIGLNQKAFERCLADGLGKAQVKADIAEGERLGVNSTPTLFVGEAKPDGTITVFRRIRGARPYHVIRAELQKLL